MRKIQVSGGNLFQIAAQYLQDATQWNRIAQANGLSDPYLPGGVQVLLIPAVDPGAGGGIASL